MSIVRYIRTMISGVIVATVLMGVGFGLLAQAPPQALAQAPSICHTAMVLDRSGSVGPANLETMRQQILRLFQPTGIYDDNVQLAFWSFSYDSNPATNFDAPFNGFVKSKGIDGSFQANLNKLVSFGNTDYEQGFGYNRGVLNTHDGMDAIIQQSNIIVFMTDGLPNTPGNGNNNQTAINVARNAVLKLKAQGKIIIGGIVGNESSNSLDVVINGPRNNRDKDAKPIFHISGTYQDLAQVLNQEIGTQCDLFTKQATYSLIPSVTSSNAVITGSDSASFSYNVNDTAKEAASNMTKWSVKRIFVDKGQSADALLFGNEAYRDNYSCGQLLALVAYKGSCSDVASGKRVFRPGANSLDSDAPNATNVMLDDSLQVGTKICYVVTLDRPTEGNSPVDRYSKAACVTVGKRPTVQVYGGDLMVGRHFVSDKAGNIATLPSVDGSLTIKNGRTYGSWAEYGIFSPGVVVGFGSMSGLEGGYESALPNTQQFWSKLTFANTGKDFGLFTEDNGLGTIPDVKAVAMADRSPVKSLADTSNISFSGDMVSGVYLKDHGNVNLSTSTINPGKSFILYVPDGSVTITGNIHYLNGPYTSVDQIPQLIIIANNITVGESVANVDAWLIADSEVGGEITTCDNQIPLTSQICNQPLRINGPVMARHLSLRRTGGAGADRASGDPAEIINLPANTILWAHDFEKSEVRAQTTFITELPPYF